MWGHFVRGANVSRVARELRPLQIGELVDGAINITRLQAARAFGVAALCFFPVALIQWWDLLGKSLEATPDGATLFVNLYFFGAGPESIAFAVSAIAAVVVLRVHVLNITDQELFGLPDRSPQRIWREVPRLVAHAVPKYAAIALGSVLVIPAIALLAFFSVSESSIYSEQAGPFESLKRSYRLTKNRFGGVLGTILIFGFIRFSSGLLVLIFTQALVATDLQPASARLMLVVSTYCASVLIWPVVIAAKALLYADLRVRQEALDLDLMLRSLANADSGDNKWDTISPNAAPVTPHLWEAP